MTTTSSAWRNWQAIAIALGVLALGLALIGARGELAAADGPVARASRTANVDIANFAFHPPTLKVAKGARVAFSNSSDVTHTATRGGSFDTGPIKPGRTATVRFKQKGSFAYHCTIHPSMRGKIIVG